MNNFEQNNSLFSENELGPEIKIRKFLLVARHS